MLSCVSVPVCGSAHMCNRCVISASRPHRCCQHVQSSACETEDRGPERSDDVFPPNRFLGLTASEKRRSATGEQSNTLKPCCGCERRGVNVLFSAWVCLCASMSANGCAGSVWRSKSCCTQRCPRSKALSHVCRKTRPTLQWKFRKWIANASLQKQSLLHPKDQGDFCFSTDWGRGIRLWTNSQNLSLI